MNEELWSQLPYDMKYEIIKRLPIEEQLYFKDFRYIRYDLIDKLESYIKDEGGIDNLFKKIIINDDVFMLNYLINLKKIKDDKEIIDQCTALMYASRDNKKEMVKILLENNISRPECRNKCKMTALMYASCYNNNNKEIVKMLIDTGCSHPEYKDVCGLTALMCASSNNNIETVEILLKTKESRPEYQTNFGFTALKFAQLYNNVKIIELLES